jgi:tRNA A58 N-methylase Trm61
MIETAQIEADDLVYDLGCGDGRLVITAAVQKGCRGIGFDIEPERVAEAQANVKLHDVESLVEIRLQDVFKVDLSEADVVLMYLLPQMLRDLKPQFAQCRPGTRLVSHDFQIEGVQVDRTVEVFLPERHFVHLYVTPLKPLPPQSSPRFEIK